MRFREDNPLKGIGSKLGGEYILSEWQLLFSNYGCNCEKQHRYLKSK